MKRKLLSFILAIMMVTGAVPAFAQEHGTLGEDGLIDIVEVGFAEYYVYEDHAEVAKYSTTVDDVLPPELTLEAEIDEKPVTAIRNGVFRGQPGLRSVTVPESVVSIGSEAFSGCPDLVSVSAAGAEFIDANAFLGCPMLKEVELSENLKTLSDGLFMNCTALKSIAIPKGTEVIGVGAFKGCTALENIKFAEEAELKKIEYSAFEGCTALERVILPEGIVEIGADAFADCFNIYKIHLPDSLRRIGEGALWSTAIYQNWLDSWVYRENGEPFPSVLYIDNHLIATNNSYEDGRLEVEEGTVSIAAMACAPGAYTYSRLHIAILPDSLKAIGASAFDDAKFKLIEIPGSVELIDDGAFQRSDLQSAYIPDTVKELGEGVFNLCRDLEFARLPSHLTKINPWMFRGTALSSFNCPSGVTEIGDRAFAGCDNLVRFIYPEKLEYIGDYAFSGCGFTQLSIPDTVTALGNGAIEGCDNLTYVYLPDSVTDIGTYNFSGCGSLETVILSDSLTGELPYHTFTGSSVREVYIPAGITSIENFSCDKLRDVYFGGSKTDWLNIDKGALAKESLARATIHYNSDKSLLIRPDKSGTDLCDININGHGTAYGWFKVFDANGIEAVNCPVTVEVDGGAPEEYKTDDEGYLCVILPDVRESGEYKVHIYGSGIKEANKTMNVTVEPLTFSSTYEAVTKVGASAGLGLGAGVNVGAVEAEAELASVGVDGSKKVGVTLSQEYKDDKNKISITVKKNYSGAVYGKVGLWADASAFNFSGVGAKLADVNGKAVFGSSFGVTYEDEDFNLNNGDDEWDLSMFMLSALLDPFASNALGRHLTERIGVPPATSYNHEYTITNSGGASAGVVEFKAGNAELKGEIFGVDTTAVFSHSEEDVFKDNSVKYKSGITVDAMCRIGDFSLKVKADNDVKETAKHPFTWLSGNLAGGKFELQAKRDEDDKLSELSYTQKDESRGGFFWNKSTLSDEHMLSYKDASADALAQKSVTLWNFTKGNKGLLNTYEIADAVKLMTSSGEQGAYSNFHKNEKGFDFNFSLGAKYGLDLGLSFGLSGIESYKYERGTGLINNNELFLQSWSDVENDVNARYISVEDIICSVQNSIDDFLSSCLNKVGGWLGGAIDSMVEAGQAAVGWVTDKTGDLKDWFVDIVYLKDSAGPMSVLAVGGEAALLSTSSVATTVGDPYIISVTDKSGEEVTDLSESPLLLTLEYTNEQLSAAGVGDINDVKVYFWDVDRCVYVYMGGEHNAENMSVSLEITEPGQYILAADNCPPAVTEFKASDGGSNPTISAIVSDMSGIAELRFSIDGEELVNADNIKDYYAPATAEFVYPITDKLSDGEHTAEIFAVDSAGNELDPPAKLLFTINNKLLSINEVSAVPAVLYGPAEVTARVSGEKISSVLLNVSEEDEQGNTVYTSYEMKEQNGVFAAVMDKPAPGRKVSVWVSAFNTDGNRTESERQYAVSGPEYGAAAPSVTAAGDGSVEVTVTNHEAVAGCKVILAVYGREGELIQAFAGDVADKIIFDDVSADAYTVKAMLWDSVYGMTPLCDSVDFKTYE
ncbi:MAG: leucine-rich repeat domain-containing protein [Oscillospiraceae bacterium]|nr:leucine-rich repeat domain-containing protein [Oscillospiraceae bacterium]